MNISAIAIRRPVFTVMVTVALLVLGVVGFARLGTDLFPDVTFPVVAVNVPYPGASPSEVENLVTKPFEDAVVSLNGIDRVRTFSREGSSTMIVIFKLGVDITEAATEVRERISQARYKFPTEVKEPIVKRFDVAAAPILTYTLRGDGSLSSHAQVRRRRAPARARAGRRRGAGRASRAAPRARSTSISIARGSTRWARARPASSSACAPKT